MGLAVVQSGFSHRLAKSQSVPGYTQSPSHHQHIGKLISEILATLQPLCPSVPPNYQSYKVKPSTVKRCRQVALITLEKMFYQIFLIECGVSFCCFFQHNTSGYSVQLVGLVLTQVHALKKVFLISISNLIQKIVDAVWSEWE